VKVVWSRVLNLTLWVLARLAGASVVICAILLLICRTSAIAAVLLAFTMGGDCHASVHSPRRVRHLLSCLFSPSSWPEARFSFGRKQIRTITGALRNSHNGS
jgi:hypothetical protein